MIEQVPRPDWEPIPRPGVIGVTGRVLLKRAGIAVANLRFSPDASIDEHSAPFEIDVICISGEGFVSIGKEVARFRAGERVVWPAGVNHRLWTQGTEMETVMVERTGS